MDSKDYMFNIGNYIDKNGNILIVDYGILMKIENGSVVYKPVKLDKEILFSMGYVYNDEWDIYHVENATINNLNLQKNNIVLRIMFDKVKVCKMIKDGSDSWKPRMIYLTDINYIHELQNIIHSLTKIKLVINNSR